MTRPRKGMAPMGKQSGGGDAGGLDRCVQEGQPGPYKVPGKWKEGAVCRTCGALFHKGRWTWGTKPTGADEIVCPACLRIEDKNPKGFVTLKGAYKDQHRDQVMGLIHNAEAQEKKEYPLARIMTIENRAEGLVVLTTDTHLPRRIGEALKHAHHGELELQYDKDEDFIRVTWIG